ncbi:MAG: GH92 family glycosyl hydrolase [Bacteroidia bacterium]|nr:GH92 family glycosyl hydrolase [Bacteroidia bacterium]
MIILKNNFVKIILAWLVVCFTFGCKDTSSSKQLTGYVNPLLGTLSEPAFSHGNTYPSISLPWAMTAWTPQTGEFGWIYTYQSQKIQGIRATHQPSPWMGDYGQFSLMPMTGTLKTGDEERASAFKHENEKSTPFYYSVHLDDYDIRVEVTPTLRAASLRFTYPDTQNAFLLLDMSAAEGNVTIDPENRTISGFTRINSGGVPENFACYFVARFDKPFEKYGVWQGEEIWEGEKKHLGVNSGAYLRFATQRGNQVNVQIGTSFISIRQAQQNLDQEIGTQSFEAVRDLAQQTWEKELSRIEIEGGTEAQLTTFYTAYYRLLNFPRVWYESDSLGNSYHFSPYDGQVHPGVMYTDNGFWDTFRAVFPFFSLMYPERDAEIIQGLINSYKEGDWFPKWTSPGYRDVMIGTHTASVIADAYNKGIRNFEIETAFEGMIKDGLAHGGPGGKGRRGNDYYTQIGYVPSDKVGEATARTLEFAYGDFCIGQMAAALGKNEVRDYFYRSSYNYRNVYDPTVGFMRGKLADGSWRPDFSPIEWGGPFTEGSSWHYSWSVMQNPRGLIELMGGDSLFADKLDRLFATPPDFQVGSYGNEIHEMTEMVKGNMGQYAHGNQPVHHLIYLYNYARQPWKTQYWTREVLNRLYGPGPDGLCGDEDNGQMSAWYIFSALGFYPVCPGVPQYVMGAPLFKKVTLHLPQEKTLTISAAENSDENRYVQKVWLNGKETDRNWFDHNDLSAGGEIVFDMGNQPNRVRGISDESLPFSLQNEFPLENILDKPVVTPSIKPTVETPLISNHPVHFREKFSVTLSCPTPGAELRYSLDGSSPLQGQIAAEPVEITSSATLRVIAVKDGFYKSPEVSKSFIQLPNEFTVSLKNQPHEHYPAGGGLSLIDGVNGSSNFHDGKWLGFEGNDLEAEIDLKESRPVKKIAIHLMENQGSWIFFPQEIQFYVSENGRDYNLVGKVMPEIVQKNGSAIRAFSVDYNGKNISHLCIIARNTGIAPDWHSASGGKVWLFADEIEIE